MIFHHEGIVSQNIDLEKQFYERLGFSQVGEIFVDPTQRIRGLFMKNGEMCVELLEPFGEQSPLKSYNSRGIKIYHHAFVVDDLDRTLKEFDDCCLFHPPTPSVAFGGKRIAFVLNGHGLLLEFIES